MRRGRRALPLMLALISITSLSMAGESEAPALIEKAIAALARADRRGLARLVSSDRVATFEAVERLLNDPAGAPPGVRDSLARAYQEAFGDSFLVERVALFGSWTPEEHAARAEAKRWNDAARTAQKEGRQDEAVAGFERSLKVSRVLKDRRLEGRTLLNMAGSVALKGESRGALALLDEALVVGRITGDQVLLAAVGMNRAYALEDLGDFEAERKALEATLPLTRAMGDADGEAIVLESLCSLAINTSNLDEAERLGREVARLGEQSGDAGTSWAAWINLAHVESRRGNLERADRNLRRAAEYARQGGLPVEEAGAEYNMSNNARRRGDLAEARSRLVRARQAIASTDHDVLKGRIEVAEASLLVEEGRYAETLPFLDAAASRLDGIDVAAVLGEFHENRATALFYLGDYDGAVFWMRKALEQSLTASRKDIEATCRTGLGRLLAMLGDKAAGLDELEKAARIYDETEDRRGRATTSSWIGELKFRAGDLTGARDALQQAIASLDRPGMERRRAEAMTNLAALELESGPDHRAAGLEMLRQSTAILLAADDLRGVSLAGLVETEAALETGDLGTARAALARIARVARGRRNAEYDWQIDYASGRLAEAAGNPSSALNLYQRAVAQVETLREAVRPPAWRAAIQEDRIGPYRALVRLYRSRMELQKAYRAARAAKARTFAEALRPVEFPSTSLEPRDQEEFAAQRGVRAALPAVTEVSTDRLRSLLGPREAMLDMFFDGDELLVFLLKRDTIMLRSVRVPAELLEAARHPGRPDPSESAVTTAWKAAMRRLGDTLIAPLASDILPVRHLLLVPSGALHGIPFAAIEWQGRRLVETWDVSILPAAESLLSRLPGAEASERKHRIGTLAIGDPEANDPAGRLSGAAEEAAQVAKIAGDRGELFIGPQARETLVRRRAASFDRIHLAAHGRINRLAPARSYIALAPGGGEDGRLEASEIAAMRITASLVVLSGCETGIDAGITREDSPGDERIGLARAFLEAGAGSVIAGLWEMQDRASTRIMPRIHTGLQGRTASETLARLQRDLIAGRVSDASGRPLDHPFYWAGLVAYGAGGPPGTIMTADGSSR